jgi:hypothetical protein
LARLYDLSVHELLGRNLDLVEVMVPADLDYDPPKPMLAALAARTGVEYPRLRAMTLAGWQPWLFDTLYLRAWDAQETFDTYVRDNSVLLAPGEAGINQVARWRRWGGPWFPARPLQRACPVCATNPDRGSALVWRLPLMVGCVEHGCRLDDARDVAVALAVDGHPAAPTPVTGPVAALDDYTHQALITGQVALPGRIVHAGVWFRLLRSLLDEVSLAPTGRSARGRAVLERIWRVTGRPDRAGLNTWCPYEQLGWDVQEAMLYAAATALHLAADGQITPRGRLGSALRPGIGEPVYDGDRPRPDPWQEARAAVDAAIAQARTDRAAARSLLVLFTYNCRTLAGFNGPRDWLIGFGIPANFLPTASDLGRDDLA